MTFSSGLVALDPGVRSFLAWYCADSVGKIGEGAFFRIQRLCERLDDLLSMAHYRFGMFLRHKAHEAGVVVLDVNEAYTTKTVSWTGELLEDVCEASVIVVGDDERMDRDYNGARGIHLRALGDSPVLRAWLSARAASVDDSRLSGNMRAVA